MTLKVIGAGVGRTGTYTLRSAINQLGLGPTHHMMELFEHMAVQLPLWRASVAGNLDWASIYHGYISAVDWPTAAYFRELRKAYPEAKFILTVRNPESWAESFSETIYTAIAGRDKAPPPMQPWINWATEVIAKTGFPDGLDKAGLVKAFNAHSDAVRETIPSKNLLVFEVKQGWQPLCQFLGVPVPGMEFPKTNSREEFWERMKAASA